MHTDLSNGTLFWRSLVPFFRRTYALSVGFKVKHVYLMNHFFQTYVPVSIVRTMIPSSPFLIILKPKIVVISHSCKRFCDIGTFLCKLYKLKQKSVDGARYEMFNVKIRKENNSF